MSDEHDNGSDSGVDPESLYKPPAQKTVQEILEADKEDESLRKYKETLLGANVVGVIIDAKNPKNVLVRSLTLVADGRAEITMDLADITNMDKKTFVIKEGCQYRLRINFHVQREIVAGLKYIQKAHRMGVQVHKEDYMVGSYAPKPELQSFTTPVEEAPTGMMHRGSYKIKSKFTDDDNHEWLSWEWNLEIKKDWE